MLPKNELLLPDALLKEITNAGIRLEDVAAVMEFLHNCEVIYGIRVAEGLSEYVYNPNQNHDHTQSNK